jgi:hypothetical protein
VKLPTVEQQLCPRRPAAETLSRSDEHISHSHTRRHVLTLPFSGS